VLDAVGNVGVVDIAIRRKSTRRELSLSHARKNRVRHVTRARELGVAIL
jgi:hypothetical protein